MNDDFLTNPHDTFFKESFCRKDVAESFVREYLPEKISKQLDYTSLEIGKIEGKIEDARKMINDRNGYDGYE